MHALFIDDPTVTTKLGTGYLDIRHLSRSYRPQPRAIYSSVLYPPLRSLRQSSIVRLLVRRSRRLT